MNIVTLSVVALVAAHTASGGVAPRTWTHTRPLNRITAALVAEAAARSPIVRSQLDLIERTDVVVYVSHSIALPGVEPEASVRILSSAAGRRYLIVQISSWRVPSSTRIALLGHELHHVLEIAASPEVQDGAGLRQLYLRIGFEHRRGRFESVGARQAGERIRNALIWAGR